ncbi:MAG: UDP-N-acetylmuramate dehydrogenase [Anaerolineaceae bacterium]|nr:UDP-N-acetylmuramate dehydrogenase [Anaerolineaceae bacterium]
MSEHVKSILSKEQQNNLINSFGDHARINESIAPYTTIRIGGSVDVLMVAHNETELSEMTQTCWDLNIPMMVLGNGSNVLVSDKGIRGVCIINHADQIKLIENPKTPGEMNHISTESGALLGKVSRFAEEQSLTTFEWAEGIPGTIGGSIIGNAGAYGGEIAGNFISAKILQRGKKKSLFISEDMDFRYRYSTFKHNEEDFIVLSAIFKLVAGEKETIRQRMLENQKKRRKKQPSHKSIGSVFKNPANDYAGRLINRLNLKGMRIGDVMISYEHANIFVNVGKASSIDYRRLIELTQKKVLAHYGIQLEPEILFLGEW